MTGIHLPPGLAPGQAPDPQALRTAIAVDQVAALQPVAEATESNVQNTTGQAIRHSALASGPNAMPGQGALLPGASTQESLSAAARAILAVMDGAEAQLVRSKGSLLPAAPTAASAQATAAALANAVGQSGLFYESHLAQWVAGARGLASLRQEPQAQVPVPGRPAVPASASQGAAAAPPSLQLAYAGSGAGAEPARPSMPPLLPASQVLAEALASAGNPRVAHSHAAAEQALRQGTATTAAYRRGDAAEPAAPRPSAAMLATQAYQSTAEAGGRLAAPDSLASQPARASDVGTPSAPAAAGPAIHPATEGVVRQQLELLATQQFRLAGEAWPGVPMEWELLRAEPDATAGHGEAARPWSSRLRLQLPNLGVVEAVLTLGPGGLDARVATPETDVAARLIAARPQLRSQLEAHGIAVQRLSVQTWDSLAQGAMP
ncbi:flagellar hook-length control protein FliK [Cupriavidus taiwanensis]|uniref:flagellar hook-length control protein FliK n=1 Tax=Cupriavidus taiwanensis TaxID=164546 RepID=UPI000E10A352|nr:flagellar hook-length control protein FliK [Cupriavidus taiwanensis]SOY59390.1 Flagellar hook-length control protein FliK [Cupriavidus taiwanensis]SOY59778.1 Flagellar hook-length control protein FliK [Cupriavidus taiwanensis]SOY91818.1 Flagellar hook-length control protein FliK [Cupriavidus taiwanensis]SOZ73479.1 Flagellar hook-length control protein FliK [Cupriavidus taiwanensis]SOZ83368.1 Flagellar hook-length control protein FliK [Cupriavidus taiwanensis]